MIALFAIISNALSPEVFSQVQGGAGMAPGQEICHAMPSMPSMQSMDLAAQSQAQAARGDERPATGHPMKNHACCKVCVCHLAAAALPSALDLPSFLPTSHEVLPAVALAGLAAGIFNTKSSPRGPPPHV